jgi:hypothetical protein
MIARTTPDGHCKNKSMPSEYWSLDGRKAAAAQLVSIFKHHVTKRQFAFSRVKDVDFSSGNENGGRARQ